MEQTMSLQSTLNTKLNEDGYLTPTEAAETAEMLSEELQEKADFIRDAMREDGKVFKKKGKHDSSKRK